MDLASPKTGVVVRVFQASEGKCKASKERQTRDARWGNVRLSCESCKIEIESDDRRRKISTIKLDTRWESMILHGSSAPLITWSNGKNAAGCALGKYFLQQNIWSTMLLRMN